MSTEHLQTSGPERMDYEKWKEELIAITAKESGIQLSEVKIDDEGAKEWWQDGFTPYVTFRENFKPTGGWL